ncbi:proline and serine-rich protein 3 isoform X2 [Antennarius striatus]|uniref:proline and serine-rich protein 3 isoform X2 n=1 Tax=Antennarius striatus TaxID=241820 RepID=UPI0035AF9CCD
MKSSRPLFTRQNPFQTTSRVEKAHYHPSHKKTLSKKEKKTTLSPVRLKQQSCPKSLTASHKSQQLTEKQHNQIASADGEPGFTESWPSTESGSSPASTTNSCDMSTNKQASRAGKPTASSEFEVQQSSLLSKYVERFRHAPPQSREDRQKIDSATGETQLPFWWILPSSPISTQTITKDGDVIQSLKDGHGPAVFSPPGDRECDGSISPDRESFNILSDISQGEVDDTETLQLQEKANRLLLRDECTQSDESIHVSSDGLGCSDFSTQVSVDEPLRRPLIPMNSSSYSGQAISFQEPFVIPTLVTPTRPEEDILFQWRLRRKMEQARERPQPLQHSNFHSPTFRWQRPIFSHPTSDRQFYKQSTQPPESSQKAAHPYISHSCPEAIEAHPSCPPSSGVPPFPDFHVSSSSVSQTQAMTHVPAHMHLLCDVLPCPIQSSHDGRQQNISQNIDESHVRTAHKKLQIPAHSGNSSSNEPCREHLPSPPPVSSGVPSDCENSARIENDKVKKTELAQKTTMSFRKHKRHTVGSRKPAVPGFIQKDRQKVLQQAEQQQEKGAKEKSSDGSMPAPPPSPVHSALREVVSEVLNATADSYPARRASISSTSSFISSAPLPSSVPACDAQNSMGVISQLLQEADDSDEKEFEDDPLLQVLRKQRSWVKEQIREVDSLLNELQDKQPITLMGST